MAWPNSQASRRAVWWLPQLLVWHCCTAATVDSVWTTYSYQNATIVRKAEELLQAVNRGDPHIEIQEHLFFTSPALNYLGIVPDTVKSIRGNCNHLPKGKGWVWKDATGTHQVSEREGALQNARYAAPKRPLVPNQCVIATMRGLMVVVGRLWLDGVYIRRRSNHLARAGDGFTSIKVTGAGQLWATHVTIQGDYRAETEALKVESKAFCHKTLIADHRGSGFSSPVNITLGATLSLLDTTITDTRSSQETGPSGEHQMLTGAAITAYTASKVRLQGCSFSENQVAHLLETLHDGTVTELTQATAEALEATYYSDNTTKVWWGQVKEEQNPRPLVAVPYEARFLGPQSIWFVDIQKALPPISRIKPPPNPPISELPAIPGDESNEAAAGHQHAYAPITQLHDVPDDEDSVKVPRDPELELDQEQEQLVEWSKDGWRGELPPHRNLLKLNLKKEVEVRTREELDKAIQSGVKHIVLLKHLDLTDVESPAALSIIPDTVQSIRGNCTCLPDPAFKWAGSDTDSPCYHEDPPSSSAASPLPLKPRQCLIEVQQGGLRVVGRLLLEGVYFRRVVPEETKAVPSKLVRVHGAGELYMKDVTLQGLGGSAHDTQALHVSAKAVGLGVVVDHADGATSAITVAAGATLSLNDSCMRHTDVTGPFSGLVQVGEEGKLRLQSVSMHDNKAPAPQQVFVELAAEDGTFMYSDALRTFCGMNKRGCVKLPMKPVQDVPSETAFLFSSDTWVVLLEEDLEPIDRESQPDCKDGGLIERAVMHLITWLAKFTALEAFSYIAIAIAGFFCYSQVSSYVNASAEGRTQMRNDRHAVISRWKQAGWLIAARFQRGVWHPIQRRIPGLPNPRGPRIEEVRGPGGGAIMPPERVQTADLVAPPPLDEVLVPAPLLPESQNTAAGDRVEVIDIAEGLDGGTLAVEEDPNAPGPSGQRNHELVSGGGASGHVEVIDISGEDGGSVVVLNPQLEQPLASGSQRNEELE